MHSPRQGVKSKSAKKIEYEYFSTHFSDPESEGKPVPMTWICDTGLKTWEFVCLDKNQMPVARFRANVWALKKIGLFELLGRAREDEGRDEVVVTGLTLFYVTVMRVNNVFNLLGSIFSKPGNEKENENERKKTV